MSNAALFIEALDTIRSLGWAVLVWIILLAVVASLALYAIAVAVACACRAVRRGVAAALALAQRSRTPEPLAEPQKPEQPRTPPRWAREPHDYEDAA